MAMELDEILFRVSDLETKRLDYVRAAETWEKMWMLKGFAETPEQALRDKAQEQVTLPTPFNVVMLAKRLISTDPRIEVPSNVAQDEDDQSAQRRERFLTGFWQRLNREQRRDIIADAAWQVLVRGRGVLEVKWVRESLPVNLRKRRLPILVRTLDPIKCGIKRGPLWTDYAYHKYVEERSTVMQRYPELKGKQRREWNMRTGTDEVEIVDFWYTDQRNGDIWNAVVAEGEFVVKPFKTAYPDIPLIEFYGDSAPIDGEEWRGLSILHPLKQLWPYMNRLASQIGTGLLYYFWPAILVESESGVQVPDIDIKPGTTTTLPAGVKVNSLMNNVNMPLAQSMIGTIDGHMQMSTFPGVLYGQAPGEIQAGYAVSMLADQARGRINQFRVNLETAIEHVNSLMLGLIEAYAGEDGCSIWGRAAGDGSIYQESITPFDIDGMYENIVQLTPELPTDQMQKLTMWMRLVESGIVSRRTMRDKAMDEILPSDEQLRIEVEQALASEMMKPKTALRALQAYFPDSWSEVIKATPLEQVMQQETGQAQQPPIVGAEGQFQSPPQMPGMPGAGGMPPGMPPEMQGGQGGQGAPGMPQEMVQPEAMQGFPAEMAGQVTPEMLGISPDIAGLGLYDQLTKGVVKREEPEMPPL